MNEVEKLKAENERLREYADFKRDVRWFFSRKAWKTWLRILPLIVVIVWAMFRDSGDSFAELDELIGRANTDIILGIAFGALIAVLIFRVHDMVRWWMNRRKR